MKTLRFTLVLFSLFSFFAVQAQSDTPLLQQKVLIKMINGEYHDGLLIEQDDQFFTIENSMGKFKLHADKIKRIEAYPYTGKFQYPNHHDTRYAIAPSAIPLKKGKVLYSNFFLTTSTVNYGISNNISIGAGSELVNALINFQPIWSLNAKAGFLLSDKIHLGGGISWVNQSSLIETHSQKKNALIALIPFTVITLGNSESNFSLGLAYNTLENFDPFQGFYAHRRNIIDQKGSIISASGIQRVSPKLSYMTENHFGYLDKTLKYFGVHAIQVHYKRNNCRFGLMFASHFEDFPLVTLFLGYAIML